MGQAGPIADLGGPELEQLGLQQIWLVDEWQGRPVDEDAGRRHGVEDVTGHSTRSRGRRRRAEAIASHRRGAEDIADRGGDGADRCKAEEFDTDWRQLSGSRTERRGSMTRTV
jgi:hypothetical protein